MLRTLTVLALLLSLAATAFAQVTPAPSLISFSGRLANPDGTPVPEGDYTLRFSLWTALAAGTEKWNQTFNPVTIKRGVFSVVLNVATGPADLFNNNLWLEIKIGNDAPLTPRQQLVTVPFALKANTVPDNTITNTQIASDAASLLKVSGGVMSSAGGKIGLNTLTPSYPLTITASGYGLVQSNGSANGVTLGTYVDNLRAWIGTPSNHPLLFFTNNSSVANLTLMPGGGVGINTNNPLTNLDIPAKVDIFGVTQVRRSNWGFVQTNAPAANDPNAVTFGTFIDGFGGWLGTYSNHPLSFFTNYQAGGGTTVLTMMQDGRVGIGTTNPTVGTKLDIVGTAQMKGFKLPLGAGANRVLASDASGNGTWGPVANAMIQSLDYSKLTNVPPNSGTGWSLTGNAGTNSANNFLGTTDNHPLVVKVYGYRAMQYQYAQNTSDLFNAYRSSNVLAGSEINFIGLGVVGATIAGGGLDYFTGMDYPNLVLEDFGTVSGGLGNTAENAAATVGGGAFNAAAYSATVGGGLSNTASGIVATVGGGTSNTASGAIATVAGGGGNTASGFGATVPGGTDNTAEGDYSFAAGNRAKVQTGHNGTFVWADGQDADFTSTGANQFLIRAGGGVGINTDYPTHVLTVNANGSNHVMRLIGPTGIYGYGGRFNFGDGDYAFIEEDDDDQINIKADRVRITGTFENFSDARFKTDVRPLNNPLDTILNLRGVSFLWDTTKADAPNDRRRQIGFLAQEVEKVLPDLVSTDNKGYKSVSYVSLVPVLVEALKTQEGRLKTMEAENAELKRQLTTLAAAVHELQTQQKDTSRK